jgi:hypothetical protein
LVGSPPPTFEIRESCSTAFEELPMNCQGSLIYAHLVLPGLDPDEVRHGQIAMLLLALSALLVTLLLLWETMLF